MGLRLKAGRFIQAPGENGIVINESFARRMNWAEPLGETFEMSGETYAVVGVVEDYVAVSVVPEVYLRSSEALSLKFGVPLGVIRPRGFPIQPPANFTRKNRSSIRSPGFRSSLSS